MKVKFDPLQRKNIMLQKKNVKAYWKHWKKSDIGFMVLNIFLKLTLICWLLNWTGLKLINQVLFS